MEVTLLKGEVDQQTKCANLYCYTQKMHRKRKLDQSQLGSNYLQK